MKGLEIAQQMRLRAFEDRLRGQDGMTLRRRQFLNMTAAS